MFFFRENRLPLFFTLILLAFLVAKAYNYVQDHNKAQAATAKPSLANSLQPATQEIGSPKDDKSEIVAPPQKPGVSAPVANPVDPDSPDVPIPEYKDPALEPTENLPPMPDTVNPATLGETKP
jgi:cytoskeletal protein RodZ